MSAVPAEAVKVVETFLEANAKKDKPAMEACLTKRSLESGQFNGEGPEGVRFVLGEGKMEGELAVVEVSGFQVEPPGTEPVLKMPVVLMKEDGQWKIDMAETMDRMLGGQLQAVVDVMADGLGKAMEGIGQALTEALGGPPKEEKEDKKEEPSKRFENLN